MDVDEAAGKATSSYFFLVASSSALPAAAAAADDDDADRRSGRNPNPPVVVTVNDNTRKTMDIIANFMLACFGRCLQSMARNRVRGAFFLT
jgi:hypothetical protein